MGLSLRDLQEALYPLLAAVLSVNATNRVTLNPYRIVYRIEEDKKRISIARFWHSAQKQLKL
jgi:mRNA-degrading endonuclease RelE of RelBE toxin-antitoxin system